MVNKNEVKYIQSLSHKKNRNKQKLFIAEGPKITAELFRSNFKIQKIYALAEWLETNANIEFAQEVSEQELKVLSNLQTPNQVIALVEQKEDQPIPESKNKITIALDGIQDPGNLGTIIRTAHWFGIDTIIASEDTADLYNSKVVQATMGSIAKVNVHYCALENILKIKKVNIYGASLDGKNIKDVGKIKEGIIVIGNEGNGIRKNILSFIDQAITIERKSDAESLNAAVAAGIILSHLV